MESYPVSGNFYKKLIFIFDVHNFGWRHPGFDILKMKMSFFVKVTAFETGNFPLAIDNLTPLGSSPPPRAVSPPSRAELSVVEPPSSKHAADFSDEEGEDRHRRARVHTPSREDDTMDLSDSSAPTEAGSPPPHWTEPSDEDSLGDSARTAPSPGPPAPAGAAPRGAPAPDVMPDD